MTDQENQSAAHLLTSLQKISLSIENPGAGILRLKFPNFSLLQRTSISQDLFWSERIFTRQVEQTDWVPDLAATW